VERDEIQADVLEVEMDERAGEQPVPLLVRQDRLGAEHQPVAQARIAEGQVGDDAGGDADQDGGELVQGHVPSLAVVGNQRQPRFACGGGRRKGRAGKRRGRRGGGWM